jgi:hypothetical protein
MARLLTQELLQQGPALRGQLVNPFQYFAHRGFYAYPV